MDKQNYIQLGKNLVVASGFVALWSVPAHAYIGPGLGLGSIAVIFGILGSILLAIFASVWYPIKRMLKKRRAKSDGAADESSEEASQVSPPA
ncbi:MAG: hypothetical protein AAFR71_05545 [Pseudomonadota bacterium]